MESRISGKSGTSCSFLKVPLISKNHAFAYALPTIWNDLCYLSLYFISKSKCNYGTILNVTCFVKNSVISLIKYDYFQLCIWLIPLLSIFNLPCFIGTVELHCLLDAISLRESLHYIFCIPYGSGFIYSTLINWSIWIHQLCSVFKWFINKNITIKAVKDFPHLKWILKDSDFFIIIYSIWFL